MPLNQFFAEQGQLLRQFKDSPDTTLRVIQVAPDIKQLVLRWLAACDGDDPHVLVVTDVPFTSVDQFFTAALNDVVAQNEPHRDHLHQLEIQLPSPDQDTELSARHRFKRYTADVAEAFPPDSGNFVILFDPSEVLDESGYRDALAYLAANTRSPRAKYIALDRLQDPALTSVTEATPRASLQQFHLSPDEVERRVNQELALGKLEPAETRRYTAMAGAFAAAHRRYAEAADLQRQVLAMCQREGAPAELASANYDLGNTLLGQRQFAEAEQCFGQAAQICLEHKIQPLLAMVLCNLGVALQRQDRVEEALQSFGIARRTFNALGNPPGEAHALDCSARVLALAGRQEEAENAWRSALALYDAIENPAMNDVREHGRQDLVEKLKRYFAETNQKGKLQTLEAEAVS